MTGLVRKATLLTFCGLVVAGAATAGVPSAATSTLPLNNCLLLVCRNSAGVADPAGAFTITVRDLANNAVPGAVVVLDFSTCIDIRMADQSLQPAGTTVNAGLRQVSRTTDALGQATFTLVGSATNGGSGGYTSHPGSGFGDVQVLATSVLLGALSAAAYDQNSAAGINGTDYLLVLGDAFNPGPAGGATYPTRSNLNCSSGTNPVNGSDANIELGIALSAYPYKTGATLYAW